jgi:hypothetical protein
MRIGDRGRTGPLYPVIVTLEEWFAFGDEIFRAIDEIVRRKLAELQMSPIIVDSYPYTICSTEDFELTIKIIQSTGIHTFMSKKTVGEHLLWPLYSFLGTVSGHIFFILRACAREEKKIMKSISWVGIEFGPREINSQSLRVSAALAN